MRKESIHDVSDGRLEADVSIRLATGNAQVIEDVQLLWQAIATKAATVLANTSRSPGMSSCATIADIKAIVRVLDGLLVFLMRGGGLGEQLTLPLVHADTVRALKVSLAAFLGEARPIQRTES